MGAAGVPRPRLGDGLPLPHQGHQVVGQGQVIDTVIQSGPGPIT